MFDLKTYFVFLGRNKLYTFVNIFGLSISLMFVIIIGSYTYGELTTDNFQKNADDIYLLATQNSVATAYNIGDKLSDYYPEIERVCGVVPAWYNTTVNILGNNISTNAIAVDSTFLSMFSFKLLQGDINQALKSKGEVLISESFAKKMFGSNTPIGKTIIINDTTTYTINGVVEDFSNSMFKPTDVIIWVESMRGEDYNIFALFDGFRNGGSTNLFIQTTPGSNIQSRAEETTEYFKTFFWIYKFYPDVKTQFIPMKDLYFNEISQPNFNSNDRSIITILMIVGLLILMFALFNYINLTVAQTGFRAKEMATRRLYGISKTKASVKLIVESTFMCSIAFVIGYLAALAIEPYTREFLNRDIIAIEELSIEAIMLSILSVILLGVISGIIPAIMISRFNPIDVVKGAYTFKSKMSFSKVFITLQSIITIVLIGCSLTIHKQVDYLITYDYGYNHKAIIDISYTDIDAEALRGRLKAIPSVKSIGFTNGTPLNKGNNNTANIDGKVISFQVFESDTATVKMLGLEFLKDNMVTDKSFWINQSALDKLGATYDLESFKIHEKNEIKVAGIVKEFVIGDLASSWGAGQTAMMLNIDNNLTNPWNILVEIQGDLTKGYQDVKRVYEELSNGIEFEGEYITTQIERSYAEQRHIQIIMVLFSIISIIISSLGLLAISSYFIQQRSREIAVRKVFGSTHLELLTLVIWKFMRLVIMAIFIASPIVWYIMDTWLSNFHHRIDMDIWILIIAGAFNLLVAFFTVYWQSNRAANCNPTETLMR